MDKRKELNEYYNQHIYCPNCGLNGIITTAIDIFWNKDIEYIDSNIARCYGCKWEGIVHNLVKEKSK
jgi:hypothetical protein